MRMCETCTGTQIFRRQLRPQPDRGAGIRQCQHGSQLSCQLTSGKYTDKSHGPISYAETMNSFQKVVSWYKLWFSAVRWMFTDVSEQRTLLIFTLQYMLR
jgi:hypothetical protein